MCVSACFSDYCAYVQANEPAGKHVIAANEGNAVGLAAGYHLATGNPGLVYLQVRVRVSQEDDLRS